MASFRRLLVGEVEARHAAGRIDRRRIADEGAQQIDRGLRPQHLQRGPRRPIALLLVTDDAAGLLEELPPFRLHLLELSRGQLALAAAGLPCEARNTATA